MIKFKDDVFRYIANLHHRAHVFALRIAMREKNLSIADINSALGIAEWKFRVHEEGGTAFTIFDKQQIAGFLNEDIEDVFPTLQGILGFNERNFEHGTSEETTKENDQGSGSSVGNAQENSQESQGVSQTDPKA